jgi:hypothetical protein
MTTTKSGYFKIGDRVVAVRDACFSWNEDVKKGDEFPIVGLSDILALDILDETANGARFWYEKK